MPGQAKIVSVTIAKAMRPPNSTPTTVTIGIRMFLSTCTQTMRRSDRPLARANFTKSSSMVSRTPLRVSRMTSEMLEQREVDAPAGSDG